MAYINQAIEKEVEMYTEEDYKDMLRETYGDVIHICGYDYDTVDTFEETDPTAFRCGFNDFQEYKTVYECPICGEEFDDEGEALECCPANYMDDDADDEDENDE